MKEQMTQKDGGEKTSQSDETKTDDSSPDATKM